MNEIPSIITSFLCFVGYMPWSRQPLLQASFAQSIKIYMVSQDFEFSQDPGRKSQGLRVIYEDISYFMTINAYDMVMRSGVRIVMPSRRIYRDLLYITIILEGLQGIVDSSKRYGWIILSDLLVDSLRRRMTPVSLEELQDCYPLRCQPDPFPSIFRNNLFQSYLK